MQAERARWAVVTGASSGIGEAFARELASRGRPLVLVARRRELLDALASSLANAHHVATRVVVQDLALPGAGAAVAEATRDLDVDLLVSNAGTGHPGAFLKGDDATDRDVIALNVTAPTELARAFGARMVAQKRGGIVFVSSAMAFQGTPYMATYAATKAHLLVFGESLHEELKPHGVDVLVVAPGATTTPGKDLYPIDYAKLPIRWMAPEAVAKAALDSLGRRPVLVPGPRNHLLACFGSGLWTRSRVASLLGEFARRAIPPDRL